MIFTERTVTVRNGETSIDAPVILYRGDRKVEIRFKILDAKFKFQSGDNIISSTNAAFAQLAILNPNGSNAFTETTATDNGTVSFVISGEMIDQLEEVGTYTFHIRLFDEDFESRITLPEVLNGFEVREPITIEDDGTVGASMVGYSMVKAADTLNEEGLDTFDSNGDYNKTIWRTGDGITEGKLNKIEDALDKINQNEIADVAALDKRVTNSLDDMSNSLDDMSNRLETLEIQLVDNDIEVIDSYNYEADVFNRTSSATWGGILAKAYPEGRMMNLTSKTSTGFTVGLATFDGVYFTPYATYVMGEKIPEIIPVKPDTYIMIYGTIGFNSGAVVPVDPCEFYDILDADNLIVGTSYGYKVSLMKVGFDISFEIVSPPQSIITSIQSNIDDLKEHMDNLSISGIEKIHAIEYQITSLMHAVEENIPEAGNEPKVLENQLIQVWDNDLSKEYKHWTMGNSYGSLVSNGFTATDACWYVYDQYLTFDTFRQKAIVTVNDASSVFGLVCKHIQKGALYLVHGDTNTITLHGQYAGDATIPTVKASTQLPFTITAGKKYLLDVFKTGWKHTFTITDMETMQSASVTFDNSTQKNSGSYCGKGWGGPGVISMSGDVVFHNHRYYVSNYKTPRVMFIGDSITEGTNMGAGVDIKNRWCSLLRSQYFGYDALICGRGGATSGDIISRMDAFETLDIKPDIVIILDGTNERSDSGLSGWKTNMPLIVSKIESWGAKPIICVPPVSSSGFSYIAEMRDFILAQGWNTIRMDIATSLNHDGQTYDSSLYTDGVHPNIKGSRQMFERAVQDLNIIL